MEIVELVEYVPLLVGVVCGVAGLLIYLIIKKSQRNSKGKGKTVKRNIRAEVSSTAFYLFISFYFNII